VTGNFDEIKKHLAELVDVVNGFKSEQVQLRVVEVLLPIISGGHFSPAAESPRAEKPAKTSSRRRSAPKKSNSGDNSSPKTGAGKKGPKKAVETLIEAGYFGSRRMIGDIASYLAEKKATTLSKEALQITLNRLVQNGVMHREKNAETTQFEYWK
jgi:hypothetical protein